MDAPGDGLEVTTTLPSIEAAEHLAKSLVEQRLVACAQIVGPVQSVYRWEGAIEHCTEWRLVLKTIPERREPLLVAIRQFHPYQVPEIAIHTVVWAEPAYRAWAIAQTDGADVTSADPGA
jgi:periplasmic divalent cation tolerance protein